MSRLVVVYVGLVLAKNVGIVTAAVTSKAERNFNAQRLVTQLDRLAPLTTAVLEVMRVTEDSDSNMCDLQQVVTQDQTIAARYFQKIANSSFYSRGRTATTLDDALTRIGMRSVRTLALAASAGQLLANAGAGYGYERHGVWCHSLSMALTAR